MSTDNRHNNSHQDHWSSGNNDKLQSDSWLAIEIFVPANDPQLLVGLEQLLQLNLISQAQVKNLCRKNLSCILPERVVVQPTPIILEASTKVNQLPELVAPTVQDSPPIFARILQSFLDELSIRWLLFIGIFLVIISSGVLAASQWQNFPPAVQYLVLLGYTFGFWGMGWWTSKQQDLRLTSQTLNQIATLLIPINFWAINYLSLGNNGIEWSIIIGAIVGLGISNYFSPSVTKHGTVVPIFLGLSYLHLFWNFPGLKLLGIYVGITVIILVNLQFWRRRQRYPTLGLLLLLTTWSLLLIRILLTELNQLPHYALAIALLAWLLARSYSTPHQQSELTTTRQILNQLFYLISPILLAIAWWMSLVNGMTQSSLYIGQTIGINSLIIHLFYQSLLHNWRKRDLTAIFVLGLQTFYLTKELIPSSWRLQIWEMAQALSQTTYFPESFLGITLFPYLIIFIGINSWLYRRKKPQLAIYGEYLTLFGGVLLTCLSFSNPLWRSLNLLLSTMTLIWVAQIRQPTRVSLVYLTHALGLVTVINSIYFIIPELNQPGWSLILVGLVVLEWITYLPLAKRQPRAKTRANFKAFWQQSCWYFGLLLSALSYVYLLEYLTALTQGANSWRWSLIWLIVPVMLSIIAKSSRSLPQRRLATTLSCTALMGVQLLTLARPETRIIALAVAAVVMLVNAFNYRRTIVTISHLGLVICLIASLSIGLLPPQSLDLRHWLLFAVLMVVGLYRLQLYLQELSATPKFDYISQRRAHGILGVGVEATNFKLLKKYLIATDFWAIALSIISISIMSLIYWQLASLAETFLYLVTVAILIRALWWRYRQQPHNYVVYAFIWLAELAIAGLVVGIGGNRMLLALANMILGLIALVLVRWLKQTASPWARLNWTYAPLVYAGCAMVWRLSIFNAYTGLIILGTGLILLNTQLPQAHLQPQVNYGGILAISLGIYELVGYQILTTDLTHIADSLTIVAFITIAIALSYRVAAFLIPNDPVNLTYLLPINLQAINLRLIAHLHWALGSILKIMTVGITIGNTTSRLNLISIATSFCIASYAVIQGRESQGEEGEKYQDWWVYVGLVEMAATLIYSRLIFSRLSLFDPWRVIFTCAVALLIYQIPWQNLGWRITPWRRTALIIPAVMALVTGEDISVLSLIVTAVFYLRIASAQNQIRWSYVSLGFLNWLVIKLVWQYQGNFIWVVGIISLSILYVAQLDSYYQSHRQSRHYLRLLGSSLICIAALLYQPLITPGLISFCLIFTGLGLRIRAFLFTGTVTLVVTALHQLIILVLTYSFLKWVVGLLAGICSIAIAASFERRREGILNHLNNYRSNLRHWQ